MMKRKTIAAAASGLVVAAWTGAAHSQLAQQSGQTTSIKDINTHLPEYFGESVQLRGDVVKVFKNGSFVLNGSGMHNDQILVVPQEAAAQAQGPGRAGQAGQAGQACPPGQAGQVASFKPKKDAEVRVQGQVRRMTISELDRGPTADPDMSPDVQYDGGIPVVVVPPGGVRPDTSG